VSCDELGVEEEVGEDATEAAAEADGGPPPMMLFNTPSIMF
jgi:hypothetical protein